MSKSRRPAPKPARKSTAKKPARASAKKPTRPSAKSSKPARSAAAPKSGPKAPAFSVAAHAIDSMTFAHDFAVRACCTFPQEHLAFQNVPHDNHPLWTLGHLATAYDWFAGLLDGKPSALSEADQKLFGSSSKPNADASSYPSFDAVKALCDSAWSRLLSAANRLSEADLAKPTAKDSGGFAKTRLAVLDRTAWHDGWHAGQVSTLRRSLGLPGLMG